MSRLVNWVEAFASSLGGPGLFVVAFLDSSFISLPEINDVLVVMMVTQNKALMPYYAAMATLGSVSGCLVLYVIGRKSGEAILRRRFSGARIERALRLFERFGVLAVVVPALLPPPAPFKVFVLLSGIAKVPILKFGAAVAVGRGIRYFGEGALAVAYGDEAVEFLHAIGPRVTFALAMVVLLVVAVVIWRARRGHSAL
jgi:membrane protein YqaA with SNARE-associated domain